MKNSYAANSGVAQHLKRYVRGELTIVEPAGKYRIQQWKKKLLETASDVFQGKAEQRAAESLIPKAI